MAENRERLLAAARSAAEAAGHGAMEGFRQRTMGGPQSSVFLKKQKKAADDLVRQQKALENASSKLTDTFLKAGAILGVFNQALKIGSAIAIGEREIGLRRRLRGRGDFAELAQRRLGGGTLENVVSGVPGLGFVKKINEQTREGAGLNDIAKAAVRLVTEFDSLRGSVDSSNVSLKSLQLSNKFAFNPEAASFQQGRLQLRAGIGAKIAGIEGVQNRFTDEFQALMAKRRGSTDFRTGKHTEGLLEKRERLQEPTLYGAAAAERAKKVRAVDVELKQNKFELDESLKQRESAHSPEVMKNLNRLRQIRHDTKKAQDRKFILDQQRGTTVASGKLGAFGVAGALQEIPKEDPISTGFSATNTILTDIKIILDGRLPKDTGKGQ